MKDDNQFRRQSDVQLGELIGKFDEYTKNSDKRWEDVYAEIQAVKEQVKTLEEFINDLRVPRRAIVWLIGAIALGIGSSIAAGFAWLFKFLGSRIHIS